MTQRKDRTPEPRKLPRSEVHVVVGGQFGSEGKGAFVSALHERLVRRGFDVTGIRVGGPQAGHTSFYRGRAYKWQQLPAFGAAARPGRDRLVIGPGAEVDPEQFARERAWVPPGVEVEVSEAATLMRPRYSSQEALEHLGERLGSTQHGVGAARAARIWREALTVGQSFSGQVEVAWPAGVMFPSPDASPLDSMHPWGDAVIVEGTQGMGLSLHSSFYPFCTSGDVDPASTLALAGFPPMRWGRREFPRLRVWVVFRPFPIRVGGNSGPLLDETTWENLGLPEERTTVTNRVRRVGRWDPVLYHSSMRRAGPEAVPVLMMLDQLDGGAAGLGRRTDGGEPSELDPATRGFTHSRLMQAAHRLLRTEVSWGYCGTSPFSGLWADELMEYLP